MPSLIVLDKYIQKKRYFNLKKEKFSCNVKIHQNPIQTCIRIHICTFTETNIDSVKLQFGFSEIRKLFKFPS